MRYDDLITLIPSHSLEDLPADLGEEESASLLNSFVAPWHPVLLANAKVLPRWHRADDPPDGSQQRLIFVPTHCEGWIPSGWADRVAGEGCVIIRQLALRPQILAAALAPLDPVPSVDPELIADFLALGFCHLQIELLTRKMRNFSNLDEVHLRREAVTAAEAAVAGDTETARTRLRECFQVLTEARERFYPVDCYLIDLCLVIPRLAGEPLRRLLDQHKPISLLFSANDLVEIAREEPDSARRIREECDAGSVTLVGGDLAEQPLAFMALNSVLWQLEESQRRFREAVGHEATVWGRRRFGLFPQWPQILKKAGFQGALHVALDDGFYPDQEYSKFRWEGIDNSSIDALSRIPLAADAAASYLRFPARMSESMDHDHTAGVIFARWPEVESPFFEDLRRMHAYAPVLGKFVTLSYFFEQTDSATTTASHRPREYLTPYLFQAVAREEDNPISRLAELIQRRHRLDRVLWLQGIHAVLTGKSPGSTLLTDLERASESLGETAGREAVAAENAAIEAQAQTCAEALSRLVLNGAGDRPGYLLMNPLGFTRNVCVDLDWHAARPAAAGDRVRVQWTERHAQLVAELPGAGFTWIGVEPAAGSAAHDSRTPPLATTNLLRNELFEVHINPATGGIAQIKGYGRSPNRLSQQLNYRFSRERTLEIQNEGATEQIRSHYAEMQIGTSEVTASGPTLGEIVTTGQIVDQKNGDRLAEYRQTVRVWMGRPVVEVLAELTIDRMPDAEPWHNYFTSRFAWHDETAALSYSSLSGVHACADERIESPYFVEIATARERTTLLPIGLPFHRKTGPRMLDSILVVPRETQRRFRFIIALDQDYPMQAALDALVPPVVVPTRNGPPRGGTAGWFFLVEPRSVQLLGLFPPAAPDAAATASATACGCTLRLLETEGRPARARVRCLRNPREARQRDLVGKTLCPLSIDGDSVLVDLTAWEIAEVEILF